MDVYGLNAGRTSRDGIPIVVFWSDEDDAYIADVPDIRSCSAHGETPEEALREVRLALGDLLEWMRDEGIKPPPPTLRPTLRARGEPTSFVEGSRPGLA